MKAGILQLKRHPGADEKRCVAPGRLPQQGVDFRLPEDIVRGLALQAQVVEHHLHVLLHPQKLRRHLPAPVAVVLLAEELQGGDGGLDLVGPEGVVIHHVLLALGVLHRKRPALAAQDRKKRLVFLLHPGPGLRQAVQAHGDLPPEGPQRPPLAPPAEEIPAPGRYRQGKGEKPGVAQGRARQVIEPADEGKEPQAAQEQRSSRPAAAEVCPKLTRRFQ